MKKERLFGLVDQCRDMADVDRLPDVGQFMFFTQPLEKLAECFVLHVCPVMAIFAWLRFRISLLDSLTPKFLSGKDRGASSKTC